MSQKEKDQLYAEIKVLEGLIHPNIVRYQERLLLRSVNELHLYMEFCDSGDLGGYIKNLIRRNTFAEEDFVWSIFAQLVSALHRCHTGSDAPKAGMEAELNKPKAITTGLLYKDRKGDQMILHRDLKPENVFLTNTNYVKLGDFGLSKIIHSHDFASTYVGTPFYMSPEICAAEKYSGKSDIWSLGCLVHELCAKEPPFNARSHLELIQMIRAGRTKPLDVRYSKELGQVISWCLKVNPDQRPDTAQLLQVHGMVAARSKLDAEAERIKVAREEKATASKLEEVEKLNKSLMQEVTNLKEGAKKMEAEITRLREAGKSLQMQLHATATLELSQRAQQEVDAEKQKLREIFEAEVERRSEEKLSAHLASLPTSHHPDTQDSGVAVSVRSSTPPPESKGCSFTTNTTATTALTCASSPPRELDEDDDALQTDITSLSLEDEHSPLAQRTKFLPTRRSNRKPFGRAQTSSALVPASPMDIQMADPSPMHSARLQGLSLSPRRETQGGQRRLSAHPLRRNIFDEASKLAPSRLTTQLEAPETADSSFCDDFDDEPELEGSPSRPTSGLSNPGGDPFKTLQPPPVPRPGGRPSLTRQMTMPNRLPQVSGQRTTNVFAQAHRKAPSEASNKENRPPSSHQRTNTVPILTTSPKRTAPPAAKKELTPSRKAPPPPSGRMTPGRAPNLMRQAQKNNALQGRTLVELSQGPGTRSEPSLMGSPMKWSPETHGEEMPSPFIKRMQR